MEARLKPQNAQSPAGTTPLLHCVPRASRVASKLKNLGSLTGAPLKRQSQRGTTLVELLTAMTIFLVMLGTIMTFYTQGAHVNRRQDQRLELMRRSLRILDRLEVLLSYSQVLWLESGHDGTAPVLLFCPLNRTEPLSAHGANWSTQASRLCLLSSQTNKTDIVHIDGAGQQRLIGTLLPGETLELAQSNGCIIVTLNLFYYPDQRPKASPSANPSAVPSPSPSLTAVKGTQGSTQNNDGAAGSTAADQEMYSQSRTIPIYNYEEY